MLENKKLKKTGNAPRMRVNRAKNEIRVLRTLIENPLDTKVEIADKLGLSANTVNAVLGRVETKELRLQAMEVMVAKDVEVQARVLDEIQERLTNRKKKENIATSDLIKIGEFSFKRSQLLDGKSTENIQEKIVVSFDGI